MKNGAKWQIQTVTQQKARLIWEINSIGGDPYTLKMWKKGIGFPIKVKKVPPAAANIIKQEALASGIDAIVSCGTINCSLDYTDVLILGSIRGLRILSERLRRQGFSLPFLSDEIDKLLASEFHRTSAPVLKMRGRELILDKPCVMGILNVTPDSFSDGGKYTNTEAIRERAVRIFEEGGVMVDLGGVSTRPGYQEVSLEEELKRVLPALECAVDIAERYNGFVSVDTMRSEVAAKALELGADLINDQLAFEDPYMAEICAASGAGVCLMHNPKGVIENNPIQNLTDTKDFCMQYVKNAVNAGISPESIVIDPGFGFGKSFEDAYCILQYLSELCSLGYPVLAGVSRKSMIGRATGKVVSERAYGTVAAETVAAINGAGIIRTHNVSACVDAMKVVNAVNGNCKE